MKCITAEAPKGALDGGWGEPPLLSDEWMDMDPHQFSEWLRDRPTIQCATQRLYPGDEGGCPCHLYRYYDAGGVVLYIGISSDVCIRERAHYAAGPAWRRRAAFMLVETYPSRRVAEAAEAQAIEDEEPQGNRKWPAAYWSEFSSAPDAWWLKGRPDYRGDHPAWAIVSNGGPYWTPRLIPCPFFTDSEGRFFAPADGPAPAQEGAAA